MVTTCWIIYGLIALALVLQMLEPSPPPPVEEAENTVQEGIPDPPREEGREVQSPGEPSPGANIECLLARLERVEDRLNIERRLEVRDVHS